MTKLLREVQDSSKKWQFHGVNCLVHAVLLKRRNAPRRPPDVAERNNPRPVIARREAAWRSQSANSHQGKFHPNG